MDKVLGIKFSSKIIPVKPVNEQFTLCKCYVMAIGKNQNKSNNKQAIKTTTKVVNGKTIAVRVK